MLSVTMMILGATKLTSHSNFSIHYAIQDFEVPHATYHMGPYKYMQFLVEIVIGPNCNNLLHMWWPLFWSTLDIV